MIRRNTSILLGIALLISLVSCKNNAKEESPQKVDELIFAATYEPREGFDPTLGWGSSGDPLFQSTLLVYDTDLSVKKDLATGYELSEDGLEWTLTIRDDVKFSDGEPLTAEDVIFTFQTAKDAHSAIDLTNLKELEKVDDYTIKFKLEKPNSTFLFHFISIGIIPKHAYGSNYADHPIGSGPYQFVQWDKGQQLIVEQNPHYYGKKSDFKKLTFLFLSSDAALAAAKKGEVDMVYVPAALADTKIEGMRLLKLKSMDNRGVALPVVPNKGETLDGVPIGNNVTSDIAIRKAMNVTLDREKFVEGVLNGHGNPAYTICDPMPWWNPETKFEDGNLEEGKAILEKAGWKEGSDGIRIKNGQRAEFEVYYFSDDLTREAMAVTFAHMMEPLGIAIQTKARSRSDIQKHKLSNGVVFGFGSYTPYTLYSSFSKDTRGYGFSNTNYYSNPVVEDYMQKALEATTQEEAYDFWKKAQWDGETGFTFKGDAAWVWLAHLDHLYFVKEGLDIGPQKLQPHGYGWPVVGTIAQWTYKN